MSGSGGSDSCAQRELPPEALVRVELEDRAPIVWACTPSNLQQLTVGWLICEGIVPSRHEVESIEVTVADPPYAAQVRVCLAPAARERLSRTLSDDRGTTPVQWAPARALGKGIALRPIPPEVRALLSDHVALAELFRDMFAGAVLRARVGGVHTGGLVTGGRLQAVVEDVSRHHVVDRLVGSAAGESKELEGAVLLLSARISGAMAAKACRARVAALATRSVPTELAIRIAAGGGLALVGRARREQPLLFWPGTVKEP